MFCACPTDYTGLFCEVPPDASLSQLQGDAPISAEDETNGLFWLFLLAPLLLVGGAFFRKRRSGNAELSLGELGDGKGSSALAADSGHSAMNPRNSTAEDGVNPSAGATEGWMPLTTASPGLAGGNPRSSEPNMEHGGMGLRTRSYEDAMHELPDHTLPHFESENDLQKDLVFSLPVQQRAKLATPDQMDVRHSFMVDTDADTVRLKSIRRENPLFAPQGSSNRSIQMIDLSEDAGGPDLSPPRPTSIIGSLAGVDPTRTAAEHQNFGNIPEPLLVDPTSVPTTNAKIGKRKGTGRYGAPEPSVDLGEPIRVVPKHSSAVNQDVEGLKTSLMGPSSVPREHASAMHQRVDGLGTEPFLSDPNSFNPSHSSAVHQDVGIPEATLLGSRSGAPTLQASEGRQDVGGSPNISLADSSGVPTLQASEGRQDVGSPEATLLGSRSGAPTLQASEGRQDVGGSPNISLADSSGVPTLQASEGRQDVGSSSGYSSPLANANSLPTFNSSRMHQDGGQGRPISADDMQSDDLPMAVTVREGQPSVRPESILAMPGTATENTFSNAHVEPQAAHIDASSSLRGTDKNPSRSTTARNAGRADNVDKKGFRISAVPVFNTMRGMTLAPRRGLIPDFGADLDAFPSQFAEEGAQDQNYSEDIDYDDDEYMDSDYLGVDATPRNIAILQRNGSQQSFEDEGTVKPHDGGGETSKTLQINNTYGGGSQTSTDDTPITSAFQRAKMGLGLVPVGNQRETSQISSAPLFRAHRETAEVSLAAKGTAETNREETYLAERGTNIGRNENINTDSDIIGEGRSHPLYNAEEEVNDTAVLMRHHTRIGDDHMISSEIVPLPGAQLYIAEEEENA